jgi:flagellar protein FlbD
MYSHCMAGEADGREPVVRLSRLDNSEFYLNAELIETIEKTPDTVISLTNGKKLVVREPADEVVSRVVDYRRRVADIGTRHQ